MDSTTTIVVIALVVVVALMLAWRNAPRLLGYPSHKIQFLIGLRHRTKLLLGHSVLSTEPACPDGYLYTKVNYSDGSSLYFR